MSAFFNSFIIMNVASIESETWSPIESNTSSYIHNMVPSPSGRWAVDVYIEDSCDDNVLTYIFDMLNMSYKRYNTYELMCLTKVICIYWVSEFEFVVVDELSENVTIQFFCHVNHEKCCVIQFKGEFVRTPAAISGTIPVANPVYYQGKQYYLLVKGITIALVPWNSFSGNSENWLITMPKIDTGDFSTYQVAFCQGSQIFMPLQSYLRSEDGKCHSHSYVVHGMITIDLNKIDFVDHCALMSENWQAMDMTYFTPLNPEQLDKHERTSRMLFRQVGEHVMAYTTFFPEELQTIYVINLKKLTVYCTNVTTGPFYFPTIYGGKLFVVRNNRVISDDGSVKWTNTFTNKCLLSNTVSTLRQLAREAQVRHSTPINPRFIPFIFPRVHICVPNAECLCDGILKTSHAEKHVIKNLLERI